MIKIFTKLNYFQNYFLNVIKTDPISIILSNMLIFKDAFYV